MKTAIKALKFLGIKADENGNVISKLPDGERGLVLIDILEEKTYDKENECCYTIINNKIEKIDC